MTMSHLHASALLALRQNGVVPTDAIVALAISISRYGGAEAGLL